MMDRREALGPQRRRGRKDDAMVAEPKVRVAWSPRGNPAQMRLLKCQVFEIFFGGARGGGKTDGVLGEFGAHASRYGPRAPYAARVAAAEALLDRGCGKPKQSHEAEITHRYVIEIPALMDNATWEAEAIEHEPDKLQRAS